MDYVLAEIWILFFGSFHGQTGKFPVGTYRAPLLTTKKFYFFSEKKNSFLQAYKNV